tara:strand:- start:640 stop:984 length:345 start_codon:yes stop_codon:yes gene_type:complete
MPNTYAYTRLEPLVTTQEVNGQQEKVVETLVAGMTAMSEDGYSAYMDAAIPCPLDPDNFITFDEIDEAWAVTKADSVAGEKGWKDALDKQIDAARSRPLPAKFSFQVQQAEEKA